MNDGITRVRVEEPVTGVVVGDAPLAGLGRAVQIGGDCPPAMRNPDALTDLAEDALERLGADLGVPREAEELLDVYRGRVELAWNNDAAVDAAVPLEAPAQGLVLGGMKLG